MDAGRDVEKQKKARRKVKVDNQVAYTDSNRAMAVSMGDKELSKALKNFEKDVSVEEMNSGVVNSEMYKRQALHYSARKQHEAARKYLESGEKIIFSFQKLTSQLKNRQLTSWTRMTWGSSLSSARPLSAVVTAQQPGVMQSLFLKR